MTDIEREAGDAAPPEGPPKAFWDRHAKLSILLIAASFYLLLFAMCATVAILLWLRN